MCTLLCVFVWSCCLSFGFLSVCFSFVDICFASLFSFKRSDFAITTGHDLRQEHWLSFEGEMHVFALTSRDRKVDPAQYWRLRRVMWWGGEDGADSANGDGEDDSGGGGGDSDGDGGDSGGSNDGDG